MPTPIPLLTEAGRAPSTLRPADFNGDMDGRLAWENVNVSEMNGSVIPGINDAVATTVSAAASATTAAISAAASAATAGAVAWVSMHAYSAYDSAISHVDGQAYRAMLAVTSTTDPFNDPTNWIPIGTQRQVRVPVSGSTRTATVADLGRLLEFTAGDCTLTFADGATLSNGWWLETINSGTGKIVTAYTSGQTSDGVTTFNMYTRERRRHTWNGTQFQTVVITPYLLVLTSLFSHKQPPGYPFEDQFLVGGGGGGGSGCKMPAGTLRTGGACGGSPATIRRRVPSPAVGTVRTFTPGVAGVGGAAQTTNSTGGNPGTSGGNTTFGSLTAYGGVGGAAGGNFHCMFSSGSGSLSAGTTGSNNQGLTLRGALPSPAAITGQLDTVSQEGGASVSTNLAGGNSIYGGASPGSVDSVALGVATAGSSLFGVGAASHGGVISDTDAMQSVVGNAGKTGGWNLTGAIGGNNGATPTAGANGAANAGGIHDVGNPGAGGGATTTAATNAAKGGDGSFPGGPGGGGGAVVNGTGNSGPGGNGAAGYGVIAGVPG